MFCPTRVLLELVMQWLILSFKMSQYTKLAKEAISHYLKTSQVLSMPDWVSKELASTKQGVFVSLYLNGQLRGCIGTIEPTQKNLAQEIIRNALSAAFQDPRFPPIKPEELTELDISVDILSKPEKIEGLGDHNPKKYGLIVKASNNRSGLLLPNLPGVKSGQEQLNIASQKGGILESEEKELYRFKSKRYH